jgi:hypothetical protein
LDIFQITLLDPHKQARRRSLDLILVFDRGEIVEQGHASFANRTGASIAVCLSVRQRNSIGSRWRGRGQFQLRDCGMLFA